MAIHMARLQRKNRSGSSRGQTMVLQSVSLHKTEVFASDPM